MSALHPQRARELLADAEEIHNEQAVKDAVSRIAQELNQQYDRPDDTSLPLVLGVMGGAVVFTGQLLTQLSFPLEFDYIHVSRYGAADQGGQVVWKVSPRADVVGRTVLVVDDILDEGETLAHVKQRLLEMGAAEVVLVVFADKEIGKAKPVRADYVGVSLPNKFVVGFGMDAYGYWRNLPGIWAIKTGG